MAADSQIEVAEKAELVPETEHTRPGPVFVPAVDIFEDADGLTVVADVPGATNDSVEVDLDNDTLTITADAVTAVGDDETDLVTEWTPGRFFRQFSLSERIDQERIEASLTDGVLRVRLPKVEKAKTRRIAVTTS